MNIETQPEALRLADALEDGSYLLSVERDATAAELRRLHAIEAEHIKLCRDYQDTWDSRDRLHAENQQLRTDLEAIGAGGVGPLIAAPQPQGERAQQVAARKDAVFEALIDFIGTLTGMRPPPIETAPPEIFKPFRDFTEKVCSIFSGAPPTSKPLTDEQIAEVLIDETNGRSTGIGFKTLRAFARAIERAHGIGGEA